MTLPHEHIVEPKTGYAFFLDRDQVARLTDLAGKQVVDMTVYNASNYREAISTSYSRTRYVPKPGEEFAEWDSLGEGDTIMSTLCRPMLTIRKETAEPKRIHDFHQRMCNRYLYSVFGVGEKDGCHEIIAGVVGQYGIRAEEIPDPMNVFMNYSHDIRNGKWNIHEPVTAPGDYIEFRADMDCLIALSVCPEETLTPCNGGTSTAIKVGVYSDGTPKRV